MSKSTHYNDPKAFIEYSNDMQDVYKNTEEYRLGKKRKVIIVFDDMIADMIINKKLNPIVTELFFIMQSYFKLPKEVRINATNIFKKIPNKRDVQQIAINH